MAWLWNSMTPEISDTCMFLTTTKDIWDAVHQTYSKTLDATQVYEIKAKTKAAKQGKKTITEYVNMLKNAMIRRLALLITKGPIGQRLQTVITEITYAALTVRNLDIHGKNVENFMFETLKSLDALGLEELFSKDEVFGALLGCNGDKATGHDGCVGLRINLEKSKLIPMGRVENFDDLAMEFGCRVGSLPCTYLGLPLGAPFKSIDSLEWSEGAVL
ncbi:hypothetical protein CK203_069457 [Vitis vinifera]|uniref:Retrotransposon gag domain-containing protein n=1 Tax=Vitis vinifera TaxID=29760 RepID=A0A438C012_VITVI|nr:hypothetical protein CK203_069457 [Vitis vinifera]